MSLRYAVSALAGACAVWAADDTESTSTLTIQSFVTVTATTNGLGDLIMQGIGGEPNTISTAQVLPAPATIAPFPTDNSTATVGWEACQTSQLSWSEAWTSAYQPEVVTETYTHTNNENTITFNVTLGNADVYTTIDGIPHAHGELKPTSVSQFVDTYFETTKKTSTQTETLNATFLNPSPNCTIAPSKCTYLWESYLEEQGMPTTFDNATEPAITPMPTQRPRCAVGNVTQICGSAPEPSCFISARKVDLYYWPVVTAAPNASLAMPNSSEIATQVVRNITMTSPSVYMIFDHLQAMSFTDLDIECSTSTPLGGNNEPSKIPMGGFQLSTVGGPHTDVVVSLDPTSLSSLVRDLGPVNTASVVSEIALGGPSYSYWINAVRGTAYNFDGQRGGYSSRVLAKPVDFHNLGVPAADAYYMNINGAPGCNRMGDHPQCSTIFDGDYRAQLLVPDQVRSLRPEWAPCFDPLYGALDPPIALTPAAAIKEPTKPNAPTPEPTTHAPVDSTPEGSIKEPEQEPATPGPTVPSNPGPTTPPSQGTPSAIPATKPDDESDGEPTSDDKPAYDDKPTSDEEPASGDQPASNNKPASDDKPSSEDQSQSDDRPSSNDKPASSDKPASDDEPTSNDKPTSEDRPSSDSNESPAKGDGQSPSDTELPTQSTGNDQDAPKVDGGDEQPQNALDVLNAAQESHTAKETSHPESHGSDESSGKQSGSESGSKTQQNDSDSNAAGSDADSAPHTQVVDVDGTKHTLISQDGVPVVDGTTLPADGSPRTISGQVVSAANGAVAIGSETVRLAGDPTSSPDGAQGLVFTADGQALTAVPGISKGAFIIDGTTVTPFSPAVTVNGATISAGSDGFVVDGSTLGQAEATGSNDPAVLTFGSDVATASSVSSGVFAIGTVTLTAGESGTTISGHTVSAASSGIVIDGSSTSTSATETQEAQETQGSEGTGSTLSASRSSGPSAASSGAAKLDTLQWAVLLVCSFVFVF